MLLLFQKYDNDVMLNHKILGNFSVRLSADKNFDHANYSCSVDRYVALQNPGSLMCETASGHCRLSWGQTEELHSCKCPICNGEYLYPDCEEHGHEMVLEVPSGFVLARDITANGLTFSNCGFKCEGRFTIPTERTLVLTDLMLESDGIAIAIEGTLRVNLRIPASFPTISLDVKNNGRLTITGLAFDDPARAKYNAIFSTNVNVDLPGVKKSPCYDAHNLPTFVTADSAYVCTCHFVDDADGDVYKEDNCDAMSAEYVLVLPKTRSITASRAWNRVVMVEDVALTARDASVAYTINVFNASFGGVIDMTFDVETFVVSSAATIVRVRTLRAVKIDTDC